MSVKMYMEGEINYNYNYHYKFMVSAKEKLLLTSYVAIALAVPLVTDHAELFSEVFFMTGVINLHVVLSFILSQLDLNYI